MPLRTSLPIPETFDAEYLEYYQMLPLEVANGRLRVAVVGEPDRDALEDLEQSYGVTVVTEPVDEQDLADAIRRTFSATESVLELVKDLDGTVADDAEVGDSQLADVRNLANQPFVIRFVNLLIRDAHDSAASDIHLEAGREGLRVRLRIDGVLTELPAPPRALQAAVVSRIKLLAELDIAERRLPQDGRIRVRLEERELDLRVSTTPTLFGESVVLRLLDRGGRPVSLQELGLATAMLAGVERLCQRSHGIVLTTGPTGSGKTTTLYAALGLRHPTGEKIVTVEDPVEYYLAGVTQVPVHSKAGVTFSAALRSILRQDPDVIMVGEMRDPETAAVAVQSAMTGHLVFSTLHTNDAVSAITRLVDLGVAPYMIAATVEGILAQRLVRKVCPDCRERYQPDAQSVALLACQPVGTGIRRQKLERGAGCDRCRHTGYLGRTGVYQLLVMTDELRDALLAGLNLMELREIAQRQGMVTLRQDGWDKVRSGITTVEEVLRVAGE